MAQIKGFKGLRPQKELAHRLAELPYDVVSSKEAKEIAGNNKFSFFHISKPEIGLPDTIDHYSEIVYQTGKKNLEAFKKEGIFIQDNTPYMYLYTLVMNGRTQTGLVACLNIDDYQKNIIKKHELTRSDKEEDRTRHLNIINANTGPVYLMYIENENKKSLFKKAMEIIPEYDFTSIDGVQHIFRVIKNQDLIEAFQAIFSEDMLYIADGHHRAASAFNVGKKRRSDQNSYSGKEEFNWFLGVIFPHDQLNIMPYNRAVKDLNGFNTAEFLEKVSEKFSVSQTNSKQPSQARQFSMLLDGKWYTLSATFPIPHDPIASLDVNILQNYVLDPILDIKDPRTNERINFIGGIRGTDELEKLVNSGEYQIAFSMFPTTVEQLMSVADADGIMPPKSTWFEPKLRSGLVLHTLD